MVPENSAWGGMNLFKNLRRAGMRGLKRVMGGGNRGQKVIAGRRILSLANLPELVDWTGEVFPEETIEGQVLIFL